MTAANQPWMDSPWFSTWLRLARNVAILLACVWSAQGSTYYVATNGNNGNPGTLAQPWLTIRYGTLNMAAGDTLNIRGGSYVDDGHVIQEIKSGPSTNAPTVVQSYNGESVTYTPAVVGEYGAHGVLISASSNIVLNGWTVNAVTCSSDGIKLDQGTLNVTLTNMTVTGCPTGMGILCTGVSEGDAMNSLIAHCTVRTNGWAPNDGGATPLHQIYIQTSGMTVENCTIEGPTSGANVRNTMGIHFFGTGASRSTFKNNRISNCNTGIGLLSTGGTNVNCFNNVIFQGASWGISAAHMSGLLIANNTCYTNNAQISVESCTNVWVDNNIAVGGYGNNPGGILVNGGDTIRVRNNLGYGSYSSGGTHYYDYRVIGSPASLTESGNLFSYRYDTGVGPTYNADFVNASISDLRIGASSSCLNKGTTETSFSTDTLGVSRPQGFAWDIGAYEFVPTTKTRGILRKR